MDIKKINFRQKKYILPLIALPMILLFAYVGSSFTKEETKKEDKELSLSLGNSGDSIMTKDMAYDELYSKGDNRTMLRGLNQEEDSLQAYGDQLTVKQKREIDSLKAANNYRKNSGSQQSYYTPPNREDRDYRRAKDIMNSLNGRANGESNSSAVYRETPRASQSSELSDPVKILKKQMLVMDSLEKAKDPEYQNKLAAELRLKANKEKMDAFMNSTFNVSKSGINSTFNAVYRQNEDNFIKAVIDENNKGYLGSRIRFRLLEDIYIKDRRIAKGEVLYGQISAFDSQRVQLNIISVLSRGEILPINLSIYDLDGMKGLYVPASLFREMMKELGSQSIQGNSMSGNEGFFTSLGSKLFSSTSTTLANLIKKNKAKLKYNSYVLLIDEKKQKDNEN